MLWPFSTRPSQAADDCCGQTDKIQIVICVKQKQADALSNITNHRSDVHDVIKLS